LSVNERFWTVVLYVVTVIYVAFCCLILGWLLAIKGSTVEALVEMGGAYGTLLTGVPVLIAVLVAKQQLDASRRQHVATVKRGLRSEIEAIDESERLLMSIINAPLETDDIFGREEHHVKNIRIDADLVDGIRGNIPNKIHGLIVTLVGDIDGFNGRTLDTEIKRQRAEEVLAELKGDAGYVLRYVQEHRHYISQYWS